MKRELRSLQKGRVVRRSSRTKKEKVAAKEIIVKGRVQRVGYRRYLLDIAQELGAAGFVENLRDGSVRIFCQASPETLQRFIEYAKKPAPPAIIKKFEVTDVRPRPKLKHFEIRYGRVQEELQEGFGAMQAIFMNYWNEFRDFRGEFKNFRGEFRDFRREFTDFRDEFRDFRGEFGGFVEEFRDYREEFREFAKRTDENFNKIMEKYGEISEKLTVILETLIRESRETREMLNESMKLLREAVEKLSSRETKLES